MIKLRVDSRDECGHVFGQIADIPLEFSLDISDSPIELPGEVDCTAISVCIMAESQTKIKYDIADLWTRVPNKTQFGVDPRDTLGEAAKNGLKPLGFDTAMDRRWNGYVRADTGAMSPSRNIQSMILSANSAIMINTNWYDNWKQPTNTVLPIGANVVSSHSYAVITGWKQVNGLSVFVINAWQGYTLLMPFDVMDDAVSKWGCTAFLLTTQTITARIRVGLLQKIIDTMKNLILALQQLLILQPMQTPPVPQPPVPTPTPKPVSKIVQWATAISKWEGAKLELNNPGNLKYSTLTKSWGAIPANSASDGGSFCKFTTYGQGFTALCNFLTMACEGLLVIAHKPCTFEQFTIRYAGNPPQGYIEGIRTMLGCELSTDIASFLV